MLEDRSCSVVAGLLLRLRFVVVVVVVVVSSVFVSEMSKEDGTPPSLSSGLACCCSMVVLRVLDWKLRSVDVLLLVLSEEKAMPGKKVLR